MTNTHRIVAAIAFASFLPATAIAATAEQAQAMSERASAHIVKVGKEKAYADFTGHAEGFKDGELYVYCFAPDGTAVAHGGNPAMVGKNLIEMKDPDGLKPVQVLLETGKKGPGWYDFKWQNPETKKVQAKSAYVIKTGDDTCAVGYYK
jgi:signal transduction histidine kinase